MSFSAAEATDTTPTKSALDDKINEHFAGAVVRRTSSKTQSRGNAVVPSYVPRVPAGPVRRIDDEATIQAGINSVRQILATHYVNRNEHMLVKSEIRRKGRHRVIDKVTVTLNEKNDVHEAEFENLQVKGVIVDDLTVKQNPNSSSMASGASATSNTFTPTTSVSCRGSSGASSPSKSPASTSTTTTKHARSSQLREWIDLLMRSIGLSPEQFGGRGKLIALTRLIPFVERNFDVVELGPKGHWQVTHVQ